MAATAGLSLRLDTIAKSVQFFLSEKLQACFELNLCMHVRSLDGPFQNQHFIYADVKSKMAATVGEN
jgi:hypothetical protein